MRINHASIRGKSFAQAKRQNTRFLRPSLNADTGNEGVRMPKSSADSGLINLDYLRKQAKKLLQQLRAGLAPQELLQIQQANPNAQINLAHAQWLIANELGFSSWPKLKAHVDAVAFAAQHPSFIIDNENQTTHWRCGHDIEHKLRIAGFTGQFIPFTDPFCLGPVPSVPFSQYYSLRTHYISQLFNIPINSITKQFDQEYQALFQLTQSKKVVFWCEADPYDQLFLIRILATLDDVYPALELIDMNNIPGVKRFVGLGQLSPEILAWLWSQRRSIGQTEIKIAKQIWHAFTQSDPSLLAQLAANHYPTLPLLAPALQRILLEYPNSQTGLSLTESLALQYIYHNPNTCLKLTFKALTDSLEPLPFLGDLMFYCLLKPLLTGTTPLLIATETQLPFEKQPLQLTSLGVKVLTGQAYALDYIDEVRWVGGVSFSGKQAHWTINSHQQLEWHDV